MPDEPPFDCAPDVFGVGSVTCPCGATRMGPTTGHPSISLTVRCPTCGHTAEVAPDAQ